uniref:NADH:ubiquinone reductase (H(+)-translocating) n=1 Tax=Rhinebothrium fulbrighti TaxID=1008294 RepID=A0A8K1SXS9_9CEST|nr:NADH dehydrogenase subunit 5 [Rhinebothrium fulbrighti]
MLFCCFILFILLLGGLVCFNCSFIASFNLLTLVGNSLETLLFFDLVTFSVLLMLGVCFGYAYYYTGHYFSQSSEGVELNKLICGFVGVMVTLVLTGDFFSTLVLWEYLGVVSFFLILFYGNYLSLRSSVITLTASRFGDVSLFFIIAISGYFYYPAIVPALFLYLVVITKSAGFPFISWLLEAMRAPTPVSSLVHSSTLVAAGVWFIMRYDIFVYLHDSLGFLFFLLLTIFITGICCFWFLDLKKIVALSTCNNISWCVLYLLCGDVTLSLFQLVSHGVAKCLLFMLVGDIMSGTGGSQASNCVYTPRLYGNWGLFSLFSIILGLSGAPYIGVYFTKHFFLSGFMCSTNMTLWGFCLICVFLSYFYSFRFCGLLASLQISCASGVLFSFGSGIMVYFWLLINSFIAASLDEISEITWFTSLSILGFQVFCCFTAYFLYNSTLLSFWSASLFGCDNAVEAIYNVFNKINLYTSLFFFRWDKHILGLLQRNGGSMILLFNGMLLNAVLLFVMLFLMCWCIVY